MTDKICYEYVIDGNDEDSDDDGNDDGKDGMTNN